jgi:hypothetical protein
VAWAQAADLDGRRPEDLATTLGTLAERRYGEAGSMLAERASEWNPKAAQRELVDRIQLTRRHMSQVATEVGQGGRGLLGRLASEDRNPQLRRTQDELQSEYRRLSVALGRGAPRPTIKEADDVLDQAGLLDERASLLMAGLAEVEEAERMRADAAVAAQKELAGAEAARALALDGARAAVRAADRDHADSVATAQVGFEEVLTPQAGELKATCGPLRLFANLLESPGGRQPAAGLAVFLDTAPVLWREHRELIADVLLLETSDSDRFRTALAKREPELFMLAAGRRGACLMPCPPSQQRAAQRLAATAAEQTPEAERAEVGRQQQARLAEDRLEEIVRDRSKVEVAEAELVRVDADHGLRSAIDEGRRRLMLARADTPEIVEARRKLTELARRMTAPPAPLETAS